MKIERILWFNWKLFICLFYLLILGQICCSLNITLVHNNDFHTHYQQINEYSNECKSNQTCFGGIARTVTKVNEIIAERKRENVLFLNAGDHFQGTVWYTFEKWKVVSQFVKLMNHDVMTLGNHEFDDGVEGLLPFIINMTENNVPIVCCNIETSDQTLKQLVKPSIVLVKQNTSIAIIGTITPDTSFLARPGDTVKFTDEIDSIRKEIANLKNVHGQDLNIFILLSHSGYQKDKQIAENIPELDIIVGGHSHSFLYTGLPLPSIEKPEGDYPTIVGHNDNSKTLVVQAFAYGKYIGRLDLLFDEKGNITSYEAKPILLDESVAQDPTVLAEVEEKALEIDEHFDKKIGLSLVRLEALSCREKECNTGNMFADAFVSYYIDKTVNRDQRWTTVAVAVINGGSVRSGAEIGNITIKDILSASPFGNSIGIYRVKGSKLWEIFQHSATQYKMGGFLQVSGIRYRFDSTKPIGQRLQSVRIRCTDCLIPIYEDLDFNKNYKIVISDYLVNGGDNYTMINGSDFTDYQFLDYDAVSTYVTKYSPIITGVEDRIIDSQTDCFGGNSDAISSKVVSNQMIIAFISLYLLSNYFNN